MAGISRWLTAYECPTIGNCDGNEEYRTQLNLRNHSQTSEVARIVERCSAKRIGFVKPYGCHSPDPLLHPRPQHCLQPEVPAPDALSQGQGRRTVLARRRRLLSTTLSPSGGSRHEPPGPLRCPPNVAGRTECTPAPKSSPSAALLPAAAPSSTRR